MRGGSHEKQQATPRRNGVALLLCLTAVSSAVYANQPSVTFDGEPLDFELPIINRGGRALYPMRELLTALGAEVEWDAAARQMEDGLASFIEGGHTYILVRARQKVWALP